MKDWKNYEVRFKALGDFITSARIAQGKSVRQLAKELDISASGLHMIEKGIGSSEDTIKKMSQVLMVDSDELLALGGKISSDIRDIILGNPKEIAKFLRVWKDLGQPEKLELWRFICSIKIAKLRNNHKTKE